MSEAIVTVDPVAEVATVQPTHTEVSALRVEQEQIIERGLKTFVEVGTALKTIRDSRLYRGKYQSFESYCKERWGFTGSYAHKQIDAAAVAAELDNCPVAPTNEAQVRPLVGVQADQRRQVWNKAVKQSHGKPTAKIVKDCAWVSIHSRRTDDKPARPSRLKLISYQLAGIADGIGTLTPCDLATSDMSAVVKSLRESRTMLSKLIKKLEAST